MAEGRLARCDLPARLVACADIRCERKRLPRDRLGRSRATSAAFARAPGTMCRREQPHSLLALTTGYRKSRCSSNVEAHMSKKDEKHTSETSNSPTDIRVLKLDEINFVAGGFDPSSFPIQSNIAHQ